MNTHLHVLEAYATLYRHWPDPYLGAQLRELLEVFGAHLIDPATQHLHLFLDEEWRVKSTAVSFGHDVEASWLLLEAAEVLGDEELVTQFRARAVAMAAAAARGLDAATGGLSYEYDPATNHWQPEKHWWVQAEALVGFLNAYQVSGQAQFYQQFEQVRQFTRRHILDHAGGEWFWGVTRELQPMPGEDKAGFWKCPYHNARACLEILRRSQQISARAPELHAAAGR